jgi:hypothetical protein
MNPNATPFEPLYKDMTADEACELDCVDDYNKLMLEIDDAEKAMALHEMALHKRENSPESKDTSRGGARASRQRVARNSSVNNAYHARLNRRHYTHGFTSKGCHNRFQPL